MTEPDKPDLAILTVELLSAYVSNNAVPASELPELIRTTKAALAEDIAASAAAEPEQEYVPAVSVRASLGSREHILSMIDGKPYKSLKRHLATHGLTPEEYRARYKLPVDYPMVAPAYSERRREVAKALGLGRRRSDDTTAASSSGGNGGRGKAASSETGTKRTRKSRQAAETAGE